jgi:hypothetical protein
LAVGSITNLNAEKCSVLKGRNVILFPDLTGFEKWSSKAKELSQLATFTVSDLLERKAAETEIKQGLDLADYLIKFNYQEFYLREPEAMKSPAAAQGEVTIIQPIPYYLDRPEQRKPESWVWDIEQLEDYFAGIDGQTHQVQLNPCSTVTNVSLFIKSHIATVKANNGKRTFLPYLHRLQELKQVLTLNFN